MRWPNRHIRWLDRRRNRLIVGVPYVIFLTLFAAFYLKIGAVAVLAGAGWAVMLAAWVFLPRFGANRW